MDRISPGISDEVCSAVYKIRGRDEKIHQHRAAGGKNTYPGCLDNPDAGHYEQNKSDNNQVYLHLKRKGGELEK